MHGRRTEEAAALHHPEDEAEAAVDKAKGADKEKEKPKPIVLDRYHFKEDVEGYLKSNEHTQLWLWDVATHKLDKLTTDTKFDESNACGRRMARTSA